ncbi:MAG: class I SAM-dependent methyltransferase [Gemmatimonadota bacterium]
MSRSREGEPPRIYAEDLAYVHHVGFGEFAAGVGGGMVGLLREAGIQRGLLVELGCGSGILARRLLDGGYDLLGVDASAAMVALARAEAPGGQFVEASMYEVELPRCAAVISVGEGLGYMRAGGDHDPRPLFRRIAAALAPGGVFIFDVMERAQGPPESYRSWRRGEDWAVLVEVRTDREADVLEREIIVFRRVGDTYRQAIELHRVRLFDPAELTTWLAEAGLEPEEIGGYGEQQLSSGRIGFVARKPAAGARKASPGASGEIGRRRPSG